MNIYQKSLTGGNQPIIKLKRLIPRFTASFLLLPAFLFFHVLYIQLSSSCLTERMSSYKILSYISTFTFSTGPFKHRPFLSHRIYSISSLTRYELLFSAQTKKLFFLYQTFDMQKRFLSALAVSVGLRIYHADE